MRQLNLSHPELAALSKDILSQGGTFQFQATGSSMYPLIQPGDQLTIQAVDHAALRIGQVVFFQTERDRLLAHRIIQIDRQEAESNLITRGDAVMDTRELVLPQQVLGVVSSLQRDGKTHLLEHRLWRWIGLLWVRLYPLPAYLVRAWFELCRSAVWMLRGMQGLKSYRRLVRWLYNGKISFRPASIENAQELAQLYGYYNLGGISDPLAAITDSHLHAGRHTLTAWIGIQLVGGITLSQVPENPGEYPGWWLFNLSVRTRYRGLGIAHSLIQHSLTKAAQLGVSELKVLVYEPNPAAIYLFTKLGFRPCDMPELSASQLETGRRTSCLHLNL